VPFQGAQARAWRRAEIARRGGKCETLNCGRKHRLQFAHKEPDGVNGRGRGLIRRILAVKRAPQKYIVLCHWCHLRFDMPEAYSHEPSHVAGPSEAAA
jgi:hypothetical protein